MTFPEHLETPTELYNSRDVVVALEQLEKDDLAESITAVENVGLAQHPVGYGRDIEYANPLLRPQLPKQAREIFEAGYRTLILLHEQSLTDYAERVDAFLQAYPGILRYIDSVHDESRVITEMRVEPADATHRALWLSVIDDHNEHVWLVTGQLQCDVARFEPELRHALQPLLSPDEA